MKKNNRVVIILKNTCLFIAFLCFSSSITANQVEKFEIGNKAFDAGKFTEAIQSYESIIEAGEHSTEIYFNLANAHYKNNNVGKAILNYERALKLSNGNKDVLKNLAIAKTKTTDEIEPLPPFFVTEFFGNIRDTFSSTSWAIFSLFFLWIGLGILILKNLNKKSFIPVHFRRPIVIASLSLALLGFLLGFAKNYHDHNFQEAIVLVKKTGLKEGADDSSPEFLSLHEGTKVELLDRIGDWLKVRLADGDEGWLNETDLEII